MNNIDKALNKETGNIHPPSYRKGWEAREKLLPSAEEIKEMLWGYYIPTDKLANKLVKTILGRMEGR